MCEFCGDPAQVPTCGVCRRGYDDGLPEPVPVPDDDRTTELVLVVPVIHVSLDWLDADAA